MRIIKTKDPFPSDTLGQLALYNGMDNLSLFEILEGIKKEFTPEQKLTYKFEMSLQSALIEMELNGVLIDQEEKNKRIRELLEQKREFDSLLHQFCEAVGYYDYYKSLARLSLSRFIPDDLPNSWSEWLATPVKIRREWKKINEKEVKAFCAALKEFEKPFNAGSPKQKLRLFYHFFGIEKNSAARAVCPDHAPIWQATKGIAEVKERKKRLTGIVYTPSTDRGSLEKIRDRSHDITPDHAGYWARPFIQLCLALADINKSLGFLNCKLEDGWFKSSFSCVTETGRLASRKNAEHYGSNGQNISPKHRAVLTVPLGYKLSASDYGQIESRCVAARCFVQFGAVDYYNAGNCLTEDHEVLTPDGWVSIKEKPSLMATWDKEGNIIFDSPLQWIEKEAQSTYEIDTRSFSIRATADHGAPYFGGKNEDILLVGTIQDTFRKSHWPAPVSGTYLTGHINEPLNYRLLAAFQADGTINNRGVIKFSFTKKRKVDRLANLLSELNIPYSLNTFPSYGNQTGATVRFYIKKINWPTLLTKQAGSYLLACNHATLLAYIEEHEFWDGHREHKSSFRLTAKNQTHLNWIATVAHLVNKIASAPISDKDSWRISIRDGNRTDIGYRIGARQVIKESVTVYCPTVRSGFFLYKRKGHISVTKNCGDLHSLASSLVWPNLPWPEDFNLKYLKLHGPFPTDMVKAAKKIASQEFYRGKSRRDVTKTLSHGTSYMGRPPQMHKHSHIDIKLIEHFQEAFFTYFPEIKLWHNWIIEQVQVYGKITTILGRTRQFFGRPSDDATLREAVAFDPQSMAADYTNNALLNLQKISLANPGLFKLQFQKHDELSARFLEKDEEQVMQIIRETMEYKIPLVSPTGETREWFVPVDSESGWNLGRFHPDENPNGLAHFPMERERIVKKFSIGEMTCL